MKSLNVGAVSILCLVLAGRGECARVTWRIDGTVPEVSAALNSLGLVTGAPYTYQLTFESSTPGVQGPQVFQTHYDDAILSQSFSSGAFQISSPPGATYPIETSIAITLDAPVSLLIIDPFGPRNALFIAPPIGFSSLATLQYLGPNGFQWYFDPSAITYSVPELGVWPHTLLALFALAVTQRRALASSK